MQLTCLCQASCARSRLCFLAQHSLAYPVVRLSVLGDQGLSVRRLSRGIEFRIFLAALSSAPSGQVLKLAAVCTAAVLQAKNWVRSEVANNLHTSLGRERDQKGARFTTLVAGLLSTALLGVLGACWLDFWVLGQSAGDIVLFIAPQGAIHVCVLVAVAYRRLLFMTGGCQGMCAGAVYAAAAGVLLLEHTGLQPSTSPAWPTCHLLC